MRVFVARGGRQAEARGNERETRARKTVGLMSASKESYAFRTSRSSGDKLL
jgi:hypothetical protein